MKAIKKLLLSFKYAFDGIVFCVTTCRNFRIHIVATLVSLFLAFLCKFSSEHFAIFAILCALVLTLEAINTAIEQACDAITKEHNTYIKNAKNCSAAAVFVIALSALFIGLLYFIKYNAVKVLAGFLSNPVAIIGVVLFVVITLLFIFYEDVFKNDK